MSAPLPKYVELNGSIVPASRARVSVFDRGLLYSDGLFETLRAYGGVPFALEHHLARLQASARFLGIVLPRKPWRRSIAALLARNGLRRDDAAVRITVTRGAAAPGLLPPRTSPTVFIVATALDPAIARVQRHGARVVLLPFARDGFLGEHKVLNYLPAVLAKVIAARHRAFEALFVDREGLVTEGTTSNVFVWRRGQLLTPPLGGILPGLTRRLVIEAAAIDGIGVVERGLRAQDLLSADEAFLTSSLAEVVPIVAVDAHAIGDGQVGKRTARLQRQYRQLVDQAVTRTRRG